MLSRVTLVRLSEATQTSDPCHHPRLTSFAYHSGVPLQKNEGGRRLHDDVLNRPPVPESRDTSSLIPAKKLRALDAVTHCSEKSYAKSRSGQRVVPKPRAENATEHLTVTTLPCDTVVALHSLTLF